jgi:hypothetical protein
MLEETQRFVLSWRAYRRMLADGIEPRAHYERLINDLAVVIRRRLGYDNP